MPVYRKKPACAKGQHKQIAKNKSIKSNGINEHGAYCARGIHGQGIYIDPRAEMVIARFASHHIAGNMGIDPTTLPAYHALAKHLMAG